jgi:hypothetical protein
MTINAVYFFIVSALGCQKTSFTRDIFLEFHDYSKLWTVIDGPLTPNILRRKLEKYQRDITNYRLTPPTHFD